MMKVNCIKYLFILTVMLSSSSILKAQSTTRYFRTTSSVFNDTLWFVNANGFQFVALETGESYYPEPVSNAEFRDVHTIFRSKSYLWVLTPESLIRYDSKTITRYEIPENATGVNKYVALNDDTLYFDFAVEKPELESNNKVPIASKELGWTKGVFFAHPFPLKKMQFKTQKGDSYIIYPYSIGFSPLNGEEQEIELNRNAFRIERGWLAPDDKLWAYQLKGGFTIIDKKIEEEIPFSFDNRLEQVVRLFFLENGKVIALSTRNYAVYAGKSWFYFPMSFTLTMEQHKNTIFFVRSDEFAFETLN